MQIEISLDGFPQVMLGITAEAAMFAAPVMIPVGSVHRAQAAQRRRKFLGQLLPLGLRRGRQPGKVVEPALGERLQHGLVRASWDQNRTGSRMW